MSDEQVAEVAADAAVAQSVPDDWRSTIPEEIRGHKSLDHIQDVGALAKSYVNAQSMIGADKIALPGKHATDDDWNEVYRRLGRPEAPDGYELLNEVPEGVESSDNMLDWFRGAAHEAGLSPSQAQKLLNGYNSHLGGVVETDANHVIENQQQVELSLKKEFGAAYADKLSNANAVAMEFGASNVALDENGKEVQQSFLDELVLQDGTPLGDHPDMLRMLAGIGDFINSKIGEDTLEGVKSSGALAPDDVRAKLSEIRAPNSPYWDQRHPEHGFYVNEGLRLQEMLSVSG